MTVKEMPERIWLQIGAGLDGETTWCEDNHFEDDVEYVRADIAGGDANEPLKDGQYRWVCVNEGGEWEMAEIKKGFRGRLVYLLAGEEQDDYVEDCYEMGPVIHPPKNEIDVES